MVSSINTLGDFQFGAQDEFVLKYPELGSSLKTVIAAEIVGKSLSFLRDKFTSAITVSSACNCRKIVKLQLALGANINQHNEFGLFPLGSAAFFRSTEALELLLENGANVNQVSLHTEFGGFAPLHFAIRGAHIETEESIETVRMLIENQADVNLVVERVNNTHQGYVGYTPLLMAIEKGHTETARMLIENQANVNVQNNEGDSPLTLAARRGQVEIVRMLIENQANVNVQNNEGDSPLTLAVERGRVEIAQMLLRHRGPEIRPEALLAAARRGDVRMVRMLLRHRGTEIQPEALLAAARRGDVRMVRMLLRYGGAEVHPEALLGAATNGHAEIVEMVLRHNDAQIHPEALLGAVRNGHPRIVEILLENGAVFNPNDRVGTQTILEFFVQHDLKVGIKLILSENPENRVLFIIFKAALFQGKTDYVRQSFKHILARNPGITVERIMEVADIDGAVFIGAIHRLFRDRAVYESAIQKAGSGDRVAYPPREIMKKVSSFL